MRRYGTPNEIVTDKLRSYVSAATELGRAGWQITKRCANNGAEYSNLTVMLLSQRRFHCWSYGKGSTIKHWLLGSFVWQHPDCKSKIYKQLSTLCNQRFVLFLLMRFMILISTCVLLGGCIEIYRDTRAVTCLKSLYFPPGSKNHEQSKQWARAWKVDRIGCYGVTQIKK